MRPTTCLALFGLLLDASCAASLSGPPLPVTAGSLTDDYLLVQGLVRGTVQSDTVDRAQFLEIVRLDREAVGALNALATDDSGRARQRARDALASLAAYAATVSATAPKGVPANVSRSGAP